MHAPALLLVLPVLLYGCASGAMRRDMDVSGELPRAIGLGAFAPACVLFCFVDNRTSQGNVIPEDPEPATVKLHSRTEGKVRVQPVPKGKRKGAKP